MTRVGWLADDAGYTGGAELTQAEFKNAAPKGIEIVDCPPGDVDVSCDRYAIHNSITYSLNDLARVKGKPAFRYWNDVGTWCPPNVRQWLDTNATAICCSRLQAEHMGFKDAHLIPPPVDLQRFEQAAASVNGNRRGMVSVNSWQNFGKAPQAAMEWARAHGATLDFYGGGVAAPVGSREIAYDEMPALLARYRRFVFLPDAIEPFSRVVVEAYAAGCELVTNRQVGALEWIEGDFDAIRRSAGDYWNLLLA